MLDKAQKSNINKLNVEYWEDFDGVNSSTIDAAISNVGVSYKSTISNEWSKEAFYTQKVSYYGLLPYDKIGETTDTTNTMCYVYGSADDYLQFKLDNKDSRAKKYTLSFMFRFSSIADEKGSSDYELPLKFVELDEQDNETMLKSDIRIPYRCYTRNAMYNVEFYEITTTIDVPAGDNRRLQLKLNGDLPTICPSSNTEHDGVSHPVVCEIDNITISSGSPAGISMKKGETYQLCLNTLPTDTVDYFTNSYLAKVSHANTGRGGAECTCPRLDSVVASVDENGLITASEVGQTCLIAVITHEDGTIERKQCIVQVTE